MNPRSWQLVAAAVSLLVLLWALARRHTLLRDASASRTAASASRLRLGRLDLRRQAAALKRPALALQLEMGARAEASRLARVRELTRALETQRQHEYERRSEWRPTRASAATDSLAVAPEAAAIAGSAWHAHGATADDCPSKIPEWDWSLLHRAATPHADGAEREAALVELSARSRIGVGALSDLARRYEGVIANKEFEGIYDAQHAECSGERFASLEGDRVLRIECADPEGARYAVDSESALHEYRGPVRLESGESVLAFCGEEMLLLSHPHRRPELAERARSSSQSVGGRRPSVLVFMIDATSPPLISADLPDLP